MANAPFSGEFESLARQYWNTWNELLVPASPSSGFGAGPWSLIGGMPPAGRIDPAAFDWFARIQRLAGQFSEGQASAAEVASAWRQALGGEQANPFAGLVQAVNGGLAGSRWLDQMRPLVDMLLRPMREQQADWLRRPAFGPAREHQERLQALALAWQEWEQRNEAFNSYLAEAGQAAFARFEELLAEHDAPGKRLESARALFDLWIDAAEEAWAGIALSDEYRKAYAEMTNALMRLRLGLQREIEQMGAALGLPGRTEVDALHRKVADLERTLHQMRRQAGAGATRPAAAAPAQASTGPVPVVERRTVAAAKAPAAEARKAGPAATRAAKPAPGSSGRKPAAAAGGRTGAAKAARPAPTKKKPGPARPAAARKSTPATVAAMDTRARALRPAAALAARAVRRQPAEAAPVANTSTASTPKAAKPASAPSRKTRKAAAKSAPAATPGKASARPAVRSPKATASTAPAASRANKAPTAKPGPAARKPANKAAPRPPAAATSAKVVSIKDWVNRNLGASAEPAKGRRGGRK